MEQHDCRPPREDRPIEDNRWTCPECNQVWEARSTGLGYRFRNPDAPPERDQPEGPVTWAEWHRVDE